MTSRIQESSCASGSTEIPWPQVNEASAVRSGRAIMVTGS